MSEFLRIKEGNSQVSQQQNGKNESNRSNQIHGLPQLLACLHIQEGNGEEHRSEEQHRQILHRNAHNRAQRGEKPRAGFMTRFGANLYAQ
jgi:hypothetical protein